jgi:hypothetical protein
MCGSGACASGSPPGVLPMGRGGGSFVARRGGGRAPSGLRTARLIREAIIHRAMNLLPPRRLRAVARAKERQATWQNVEQGRAARGRQDRARPGARQPHARWPAGKQRARPAHGRPAHGKPGHGRLAHGGPAQRRPPCGGPPHEKPLDAAAPRPRAAAAPPVRGRPPRAGAPRHGPRRGRCPSRRHPLAKRWPPAPARICSPAQKNATRTACRLTTTISTADCSTGKSEPA